MDLAQITCLPMTQFIRVVSHCDSSAFSGGQTRCPVKWWLVCVPCGAGSLKMLRTARGGLTFRAFKHLPCLPKPSNSSLAYLSPHTAASAYLSSFASCQASTGHPFCLQDPNSLISPSSLGILAIMLIAFGSIAFLSGKLLLIFENPVQGFALPKTLGASISLWPL